MNTLISSYTYWHYSKGLSGVLELWTEALWFVNHFFSITLLLSTLFTPWHRLNESSGGGFDLEKIATALLVNILMRLVGAFIRLFIILLGSIVFLVFFLIGVGFFVAWVAAPVVIPFLFLNGVILLF